MRMPIASERPMSDIAASVKPARRSWAKAVRTVTGRASPVMTVERDDHWRRKTARAIIETIVMNGRPMAKSETNTSDTYIEGGGAMVYASGTRPPIRCCTKKSHVRRMT